MRAMRSASELSVIAEMPIQLASEMRRTSIEPCDMDEDHNSNHGRSRGSSQLYTNPITYEMMIDPVYTSNGKTYDHWTIIDNNLINDTSSSDEKLKYKGTM